MKGMYGMSFASGCSSGTAAVHIALGALGIEPGREVITSAVTDMGTLTGVLYQLLVPRFADIDAQTYNMDPRSVEKLITGKTGAIIVVHHAGLPADIEALVELGRRHGIPVIEDCAQAHFTRLKGKLLGTFGDVSTWSFNHFKHITTGSGGAVLTNREDIEERVRLFIDKCYFRDGRKRNPYFLAPNYQMTELQGAVAVGQLGKVRRMSAPGARWARGSSRAWAGFPASSPSASRRARSTASSFSWYGSTLRSSACRWRSSATRWRRKASPRSPTRSPAGCRSTCMTSFRTAAPFPESIAAVRLEGSRFQRLLSARPLPRCGGRFCPYLQPGRQRVLCRARHRRHGAGDRESGGALPRT